MMAGNLSDWSENALLDWVMGGSAPTRPTARYLALFTAAPNDAGGGTEVTGSGYARQAITCGAAAAGKAVNDALITFTASGGSWGTVTHMGIFSASSGGNLLWHGPLTASKTVGDGDSLEFAVGKVELTLD
jgi:hypothetical protein